MTNEEKAQEIEKFFETPNPKDRQHILTAYKMQDWDYMAEVMWHTEPPITDGMDY